MNKWNIRQALPADAENLQQCMVSAYSPYIERMGNSPLPPLEADYSKEIEEYPTWVVVFEEDIVAGLSMSFDKNIASIVNIAVRPEQQGLGIGRGLLDFAQEQAKHQGYSCMQLATHVLLTENISLYQHLGWCEAGRDNVRVIMEKEI